MSAGHQRRSNGQGRRPGDGTVRLSRNTLDSLKRLRQLTPFYESMSADNILCDLLDMAIIRAVMQRSEDNLRTVAAQANMRKVYTHPIALEQA